MSRNPFSVESVRTHYDRASSGYDHLIDRLSFGQDMAIRRAVVKDLAPRPGDTVLDLGCGTGRNFPLLDQAMAGQGEITAVDLSPGMLGVARARADQCRVSIRCVESEISAFVPAAPVDRILSTYLLTTLPRFDTIAQSLVEWLKPGGRLVLTDDRLPPGWFLGPIECLHGLGARGWPDVLHIARRALRASFGNVTERRYFLGLIFQLQCDRPSL
jgi:demethylmenaquinone methyltransferase/2-methoxy-6-polyprenyl-1,4-benzoquinol methylase